MSTEKTTDPAYIPANKGDIPTVVESGSIQKTLGTFSTGEKPTKTKNTVYEYEQRAAGLLRRVEEDTAGEIPVGPAEVAKWFTMIAKRVGKNTLRVYRAALICHIEKMALDGIYEQQESERSIETLRFVQSEHAANLTSSSKAKSASEDEIERLIDRLGKSAGYGATCASLMFRASVLAGLRPIEWFTATIEPFHPDGMEPSDQHGDYTHGGVLTVQNAKNTNGRASGDTRKLWIPPGAKTELVIETISYIKNLLVNGHDKSAIMKNVQKSIRIAKVKTRSGRRVSLYTARHQFSANMKTQGDQDMVAALMGHASSDTAGLHYGKRRSAHSAFKEIASSQQVETVSPEIVSPDALVGNLPQA